VTHDSLDDDHALPRIRTWDDVLDLWARGTRAPSDETVGRWALAVLQRELGDGWVAVCEARGWLPPEIPRGGMSLDAFGMRVELALALHGFRDAPGLGRVRQALKRSPTREQFASTRCAPRLAAAAKDAGVDAAVELGDPPIDLQLGTSGVAFGIEIKSLFRLERLTDVDRWLSDLYDLTRATFGDGDLHLAGSADKALDRDNTVRPARRIEDAGHTVRAGLHAPVIHAGRQPV
jgi:hypothetical protein